MPTLVLRYLKALWKHWRTRIMGGSLMALAAIWLITGNTIWPKIGMFIVGATFLAASFGSWNEERETADRLTSDMADREARYMTITGIRIGRGANRYFMVGVHLVNPGKHPAAFLPDWTVTVRLGGGEEVVLHGWLLVTNEGEQLRPMQQGDQFDSTIQFPYGDRLSGGDALIDATYTLSVEDIEHRPMIARYPPVSIIAI
jgi:hypothetical protein